MKPARRRRYHYGLLAEFLCRCVLRLKGYRILAARWRGKAGEIDIVAARGTTIAIVEVKAGKNREAAALAFTPQQAARLRRSAQSFLARLPGAERMTIRFDLMLVAPWRWPEHIVSAWEGE